MVCCVLYYGVVYCVVCCFVCTVCVVLCCVALRCVIQLAFYVIYCIPCIFEIFPNVKICVKQNTFPTERPYLLLLPVLTLHILWCVCVCVLVVDGGCLAVVIRTGDATLIGTMVELT